MSEAQGNRERTALAPYRCGRDAIDATTSKCSEEGHDYLSLKLHAPPSFSVPHQPINSTSR